VRKYVKINRDELIDLFDEFRKEIISEIQMALAGLKDDAGQYIEGWEALERRAGRRFHHTARKFLRKEAGIIFERLVGRPPHRRRVIYTFWDLYQRVMMETRGNFGRPPSIPARHVPEEKVLKGRNEERNESPEIEAENRRGREF